MAAVTSDEALRHSVKGHTRDLTRHSTEYYGRPGPTMPTSYLSDDGDPCEARRAGKY